MKNPAGQGPPVGWTELNDTGYTLPNAGAECIARNNGFTGTMITWVGSNTDQFGDIIVELDQLGRSNVSHLVDRGRLASRHEFRWRSDTDGNAISDYIASMWKSLGYRAMSTTSHPAMVRSRARSTSWRMHRPPARTSGGGMMARDRAFGRSIAIDRLSAGFEYIGPAMDKELAKKLLNG